MSFPQVEPHRAATYLQESIQGCLVILQHPQGHGSEKRVSVSLVGAAVLSTLVHAKDVLVEQLSHRLRQGVINLVQATDNQSQLEVIQLVQQYLGDIAMCSHIFFNAEDKVNWSHHFNTHQAAELRQTKTGWQHQGDRVMCSHIILTVEDNDVELQ